MGRPRWKAWLVRSVLVLSIVSSSANAADATAVANGVQAPTAMATASSGTAVRLPGPASAVVAWPAGGQSVAVVAVSAPPSLVVVDGATGQVHPLAGLGGPASWLLATPDAVFAASAGELSTVLLAGAGAQVSSVSWATLLGAVRQLLAAAGAGPASGVPQGGTAAPDGEGAIGGAGSLPSLPQGLGASAPALARLLPGTLPPTLAAMAADVTQLQEVAAVAGQSAEVPALVGAWIASGLPAALPAGLPAPPALDPADLRTWLGQAVPYLATHALTTNLIPGLVAAGALVLGLAGSESQASARGYGYRIVPGEPTVRVTPCTATSTASAASIALTTQSSAAPTALPPGYTSLRAAGATLVVTADEAAHLRRLGPSALHALVQRDRAAVKGSSPSPAVRPFSVRVLPAGRGASPGAARASPVTRAASTSAGGGSVVVTRFGAGQQPFSAFLPSTRSKLYLGTAQAAEYADLTRGTVTEVGSADGIAAVQMDGWLQADYTTWHPIAGMVDPVDVQVHVLTWQQTASAYVIGADSFPLTVYGLLPSSAALVSDPVSNFWTSFSATVPSVPEDEVAGEAASLLQSVGSIVNGGLDAYGDFGELQGAVQALDAMYGAPHATTWTNQVDAGYGQTVQVSVDPSGVLGSSGAGLITGAAESLVWVTMREYVTPVPAFAPGQVFYTTFPQPALDQRHPGTHQVLSLGPTAVPLGWPSVPWPPRVIYWYTGWNGDERLVAHLNQPVSLGFEGPIASDSVEPSVDGMLRWDHGVARDGGWEDFVAPLPVEWWEPGVLDDVVWRAADPAGLVHQRNVGSVPELQKKVARLSGLPPGAYALRTVLYTPDGVHPITDSGPPIVLLVLPGAPPDVSVPGLSQPLPLGMAGGRAVDVHVRITRDGDVAAAIAPSPVSGTALLQLDYFPPGRSMVSVPLRAAAVHDGQANFGPILPDLPGAPPGADDWSVTVWWLGNAEVPPAVSSEGVTTETAGALALTAGSGVAGQAVTVSGQVERYGGQQRQPYTNFVGSVLLSVVPPGAGSLPAAVQVVGGRFSARLQLSTRYFARFAGPVWVDARVAGPDGPVTSAEVQAVAPPGGVRLTLQLPQTRGAGTATLRGSLESAAPVLGAGAAAGPLIVLPGTAVRVEVESGGTLAAGTDREATVGADGSFSLPVRLAAGAQDLSLRVTVLEPDAGPALVGAGSLALPSAASAASSACPGLAATGSGGSTQGAGGSSRGT